MTITTVIIICQYHLHLGFPDIFFVIKYVRESWIIHAKILIHMAICFHIFMILMKIRLCQWKQTVGVKLLVELSLQDINLVMLCPFELESTVFV